jgi:hypothetical protein
LAFTVPRLLNGRLPLSVALPLAKALAALEARGKDPTVRPVARLSLLLAYQYRALALADLGRTAEAAADWDRALPLDYGLGRHYLAFVHGLLEARRTGQDQTTVFHEHYAEAVAELDRLRSYQVGCNSYLVAAVCAQASAAAARDDRLAPAERQQRVERYANQSLHYLAEARKMGYFRAAGRRERLQQDREFDPLRSRPAFQELLASLAAS